MTYRRLQAAVALLSLLLAGSFSANAQSGADFYRGKTITLYVASSPGGGYALAGQLIAAHLGRHLPGNPNIINSYMPGGGGINAANFLYSVAPKDGTALGTMISTVEVEQLVRSDALNYDVRKLQWIGVVAPIRPVLFISKKAPATTLEQLKKTQITSGASGTGSPTYVVPTLASYALGLKIKVITGYKGTADTHLALARGEVDALTMPWESAKAQFPDLFQNTVQPFQYGLTRDPEFPDVPLLHELVSDAGQAKLIRFLASETALGRNLAAPPGLPVERVAALRKAFDQMTKDPEFLADAAKRNSGIGPMSGIDVQKLVEEISMTDPETVAMAKKFVGLGQ